MSGLEWSSHLVVLCGESSGRETEADSWMSVKLNEWCNSTNVAIAGLSCMLVWYHSDLFQIARTWDFIMKMWSFTTMKTCFSSQVVVSVCFSFSSFNLGTCSSKGGCRHPWRDSADPQLWGLLWLHKEVQEQVSLASIYCWEMKISCSLHYFEDESGAFTGWKFLNFSIHAATIISLTLKGRSVFKICN